MAWHGKGTTCWSVRLPTKARYSDNHSSRFARKPEKGQC
jgi:hypothetical protein